LRCGLPDRPSSMPIERLRGVGPKTAQRLREKGIQSAEDLLYLCPVSYEDRRAVSAIGEAQEGRLYNFVGRILSSGLVRYRHPRKKGFQALLEDDSGVISLNWFNYPGPHLKMLLDGQCNFFVSGVVTRFGNLRQIVHPYIAAVGEKGLDEHCKIVPVYSDIQGVGQAVIRKLVREAGGCAALAGFRGLVPRSLEEEHGLLPFHEALRLFHFPETLEENLQTRARLRLVLEEFFSFQTALLIEKSKLETNGYTVPRAKMRYVKKFLASLPFALTAAQKRVVAEIKRDMTGRRPMNRLLQGDVGCGKTLCTLFAACLSIDSGFQVALLAPTEILAEQHYLSICAGLGKMGLEVALLTSSVSRDRDKVLTGVENGTLDFVVGTHSLLEENIKFSRLGLVIIDEQHRFGVLQRKTIVEKSIYPNVLAVTATPIPRSLSMVLYGHQDVSVIDEMPPGRHPIKTIIWEDALKEEAYRLVRDELERGGQAYLVFPVIEEREEEGLSGVLDQFEFLTEGPFRGCAAAVLHGRLSMNEKDGVMENFRRGRIQLLVCTTVIEVGLDLPNASAIVIHHAERFGLAQLHQLRGRVGRGTRESVCILLADQRSTDISRERLRVMEETNDGFRVAEADMVLRGPGEILGVRQSGLPRFRLGHIRDDAAVMGQARDLARQILPSLDQEDFAILKEAAIARWGKDLGLSGIS
jgi:ATP-dependent DNA helicase RecG